MRVSNHTLPQDIKNLQVSNKAIDNSSSMAKEIARFLTTILLFAIIALICILAEKMRPDTPIVAGSLAALLGGKPSRRNRLPKPNFRIIEENGTGIEYHRSRRAKVEEDEEHLWTKYPRRMLEKEVLS